MVSLAVQSLRRPPPLVKLLPPESRLCFFVSVSILAGQGGIIAHGFDVCGCPRCRKLDCRDWSFDAGLDDARACVDSLFAVQPHWPESRFERSIAHRLRYLSCHQAERVRHQGRRTSGRRRHFLDYTRSQLVFPRPLIEMDVIAPEGRLRVAFAQHRNRTRP